MLGPSSLFVTYVVSASLPERSCSAIAYMGAFNAAAARGTIYIGRSRAQFVLLRFSGDFLSILVPCRSGTLMQPEADFARLSRLGRPGRLQRH